MLVRWLSILETYDFSIVHIPGRLHNNADVKIVQIVILESQLSYASKGVA